VFRRIQRFSFENIDKFSTASLVTRLTTDITNVQMAFMMTIRAAVRAPLMFVFSIIMAWRMGGSLAAAFLVVVPVLSLLGSWLALKTIADRQGTVRRDERVDGQ
jgi:ATP-binding cassette subfamily B protein